MTTYPRRYGDTDRSTQHYATACVASATVLRSEGLPDQAADLEDAARRAGTHPDGHHREAEQESSGRLHDGEQLGWWGR